MNVSAVRDESGNALEGRSIWRDITERKPAEESLRESEERFRLMYEQSPLGYQSLDEQGRLLEANPAWLAMLGYAREEVIGRGFGDFLAPNFVERFKAGFAELKAAGEIRGIRFDLVRKDGSRIVVEFDGKVGHDAQGNFRQTHCVMRNVTERWQAEREIRRLRAFERIVTEISSRMLNIAELDAGIDAALESIGEFADVDRAYVFLVRDDGMTIDNTNEWCGEGVEAQMGNLQGIAAEEKLPWFWEFMEDRRTFNISAVCELPPQARTEKGHFEKQGIQALIVVPMVCDERLVGFMGFDSTRGEKVWSDDIVGLLQIVTDSAARAVTLRQAQKAVAKGERYFRKLLHSIHEDIVVLDRDYRITDLNNGASATTGLAREKMLGRHCYEVFHGHQNACDEQGEQCGLRRVFATGQPYNCHHQHVGHDGSTVYVDVLLSPLKDDRGNVNHVIESIRDVSDLFEAQRSLQASEEWFRSLIELSASVYAVIDADGRTLYASPSLERWYGWKPEELVGRSFFEQLYPDDMDRVRQSLAEILQESGAMKTEELRYRHKDGSWRWLRVVGTNHCDNPAVGGCDDFLSKPVSQAKFFGVLERYLGRTGNAAEKPLKHEQASDPPAKDRLFDGLLDDATVDQLVQEYAETLCVKAEAIEKALSTHNLDLLAGLAHELKGVAGMYGFSQVSEKALSLKQLAAEVEDVEELEANVAELTELCREAAKASLENSAKLVEQPIDEPRPSLPAAPGKKGGPRQRPGASQ